MTYRELLELYKTGKLDEAQRQQVEADIEKQDAISDYLYEADELAGMFLDAGVDESAGKVDLTGPEDDAAKDEQFAGMVRRYIRRAFLKLGGTIFVVTIAVVLFIVFGLPKLVDLLYYDPGRMVSETENQMSQDVAVYSEVFIPEYQRNGVSVIDNGYGEYDIVIGHWYAHGDGDFHSLGGIVRRNRLVLYEDTYFKRPSVNWFAWFQMEPSVGSLREYEANGGQEIWNSAVYSRERASEKLEKMDENETYFGYVTLDRIMPYEEFIEFAKEWELGGWCAVQVGEFRGGNMNWGFRFSFNMSTQFEWDQEKYPDLFTWTDADGHEQTEENLGQGDFAKGHFVSLCRYLADQSQFCLMMNLSASGLNGAADYVEENGVYVYALVCPMSKEEALALNEAEEVYSILVEEIR